MCKGNYNADHQTIPKRVRTFLPSNPAPQISVDAPAYLKFHKPVTKLGKVFPRLDLRHLGVRHLGPSQNLGGALAFGPYQAALFSCEKLALSHPFRSDRRCPPP